MAVTQTDIAKAAGVSRGTVDRALKQLNDPSFGVRERMLRVDTEQELICKELLRDPKIRAIYMATQPIAGCIAGIRKARVPYKIRVICNDLTPTAKRYLKNDSVDFVIGQSFEQESQKAILALYYALKNNHPPQKDVYYTDMQIISKEMV